MRQIRKLSSGGGPVCLSYGPGVVFRRQGFGEGGPYPDKVGSQDGDLDLRLVVATDYDSVLTFRETNDRPDLLELSDVLRVSRVCQEKKKQD